MLQNCVLCEVEGLGSDLNLILVNVGNVVKFSSLEFPTVKKSLEEQNGIKQCFVVISCLYFS